MKQEKEVKEKNIEKKETKLPSFAESGIIYILKNPVKLQKHYQK